jgi:aminoglycoside phosphotransferase (APT) family kinase protein
VPDVVWFGESCRLAASPWMLMSHQPGVSLHVHRAEITPDARCGIDAQLGSHLRAINAIRGPYFGLLAPAASHHGTWRAAFGELFESVLHDGERRSVPLPIGYEAARGALAAAGAALDEVTEPRLVHWDLWDGNVLVDPGTNDVTGVLDLERSLWGDPLMEFQFAMPPVSAAFADAYGSAGPSTPAEHRRRALYTLHWHLVMSIEGTYRQYPEDRIGDWARSQLAADVERVVAV